MVNVMKRLVLVLLVGFGCLTGARAASVNGDFTLVVAPDRYAAVQLGFDLVARYPVILMAYQGQANTAEPALYAWNGTEWVFVSLNDYRQVSFLQKAPSSVVLLGDDHTLPVSLVDASAWAPKTTRISDLNTSSIVNELGRVLKFQKEDWEWFSARYNLKLRDESEAMRKSSWYSQPGPLRRPPLRDVLWKKPAEVPAVPSASPGTVTTPDLPPAEVREVVVPSVELKPADEAVVVPDPVP